MAVVRALLAIIAIVVATAGTAVAADDPVLAPPDARLPPALHAVRADLRRIVAARDLKALRAHIRDDTTLSFGGDAGPQGLDALWTRDPVATGVLWRELETLVALPGVASREDGRNRYCAPYVYCMPYQADIDVVDVVVVLGRDVALRAQPDTRSRVLARVSHAVLTRVDDGRAPPATGWVHVRLASGQQGFIAARMLRGPIDYRFSIVEDGDGQWYFQYFVAGD